MKIKYNRQRVSTIVIILFMLLISFSIFAGSKKPEGTPTSTCAKRSHRPSRPGDVLPNCRRQQWVVNRLNRPGSCALTRTYCR